MLFLLMVHTERKKIIIPSACKGKLRRMKLIKVNKGQIVSRLSECFWNRLIKQKRLSFLFIKPVCPAHFVY